MGKHEISIRYLKHEIMLIDCKTKTLGKTILVYSIDFTVHEYLRTIDEYISTHYYIISVKVHSLIFLPFKKSYPYQ